MTSGEYNPLSLDELARSLADALLREPEHSLPLEFPPQGSGVYALYYYGEFPAYRVIAEANRAGPHSWPIYVGSASDDGGAPLQSRLRDHTRTIEAAKNLSLNDVSCQYLVTQPIWIPLGESLLIRRYRPLWNLVVQGFGNHDPGGGRRQQRRSAWDTLHPGRPWALSLRDGEPVAEIMRRIMSVLEEAGCPT